MFKGLRSPNLRRFPKAIARLFRALSILLSILALFLSCWILIPAPTFFWLILSVGTPEISPWLMGLSGLALILGWGYRRQKPLPYLWIGLSMAAFVISSLPLLQLPSVIQRADQSLQDLYSSGYEQSFYEQSLSKPFAAGRSHPFRLADSFLGITLPQVRHLTGLTIQGKDQSPLDLELYLPTTPGRYPGVISIYGGAWQRGSPRANAQFNQYLAAQGYVVWAIDYRHAPAYQFPAQLEDVQASIRFIQTHGADYETLPDQLALVGRSAGAHLALLAAFQMSPNIIRGIVDFYGPVDLVEGYNNPPNPDPINSRKVLTAFLGGSPTQFPQKYRDASPINFVQKPQAPTLLFYGGRDHIVQAQYGQLLAQRLENAGGQAVFIELPWADHAFDEVFNGISSQFSLFYTEQFLDWVFHKKLIASSVL